MEGSVSTRSTRDYSTITNHQLVEKFATMNNKLAANPPPDFDIGEWKALGRELVARIPGVDADEFETSGG